MIRVNLLLIPLTAPPPPPNLSRRNGNGNTAEQGRPSSAYQNSYVDGSNILKLPHAVVISNNRSPLPKTTSRPSISSFSNLIPLIPSSVVHGSRPKSGRQKSSRPRSLRRKDSSFSTSFLPGVASSSHMLYSLLPPPKNFRLKSGRPESGRPNYLYSSRGKPPITKTSSVRPWWANAMAKV